MRGLVNQSGGKSNIKSIQRGSITFPNTTTLDITISAVDLSKSILTFTTDSSSTSPTPNQASVMGKLTTNTNINFSRFSADSIGAISIAWQVIEFNNVKSVQRGDSTDSSVTISEVNTTKSIAFCSFKANSGSNLSAYMLASSNLVSSTTLSIHYYNTYTTVHWQVIEFN